MKTHLPPRSIALTLLVVIICLSCKKETDEPTILPQLTFSEKMQKCLDDAISKHNGKGVSLAAILPDGETMKFASGISHDDVKVNTEMLFSAGSITKMFTAATIMQYVEEGKISLEDSLYRWFSNYEHIDSTINIRQMLNHTCGIYEVTANNDFWQLVFSEPGSMISTEDLLTNYLDEALFEKGTDWAYCNTAYLMLRTLIEDISGRSVAEEYRSRLIGPNDLITTITYLDEDLPPNTAYGWFDIDGNGSNDELAPGYLKSFYSAAGGGIFCTAEDLARWAKKMFIDRTVVSQESLDEMLIMHHPCNEDMVERYGLGIYEFNPDLFNGHKILGHGGDPVGYAAGCFYLPAYDLCIGIMDNTEDGNAMWVINDVIEMLIEYLGDKV